MTRTKKEKFPQPQVKPASPVLIGLIRQADGIVAILDDHAGTEVSSPLKTMPLHQLDQTIFSSAKSLQADWQSLQDARSLKAVWPAFWRVFWASVPDTVSSGLAIRAELLDEAKKPIATAAHPRAYKGTKYQPPKPAQTGLELHNWLLDMRLLDAFFARHDFAALPALDQDGMPLLNCQARTTTAFLAHGWQVPVQDIPALPGEFRRYFLWHLRHRSHQLLLAWLSIWRALAVDDNAEQIGLLARLCAVAAEQPDWAGLLTHLRPARQAIYLRALLKHHSYLLAPAVFGPEQMSRLDALTENDTYFSLFLDIVLDNLGRKLSAEYSLTGCSIATMRGSVEQHGWQLRARFDTDDVPVDLLISISDLADTEMAVRLWRFCGELPGFAGFLRSVNWQVLSGRAADTLINVSYHFFSYEDEEIRLLDKWRVYLKVFSACHEILLTLEGEWQEKMARMWQHIIDGWVEFSRLETALDDILPLMEKMCAPPFSATANVGYTLLNLLEPLSSAHRAQLSELGPRTWLLLERACRRQDDTGLLNYGSCIFSVAAPAIVFEAFQTAPGRLFHSIHLLGCMNYERRRQFMADQVKTDWFTMDWQGMAIEEACQLLLDMSTEAGLDSPLPRRLREHLAGKLQLSPAQLARHGKLALSRLPAMRLRAFENAIWKNIDAVFQLRDYSAAARHALRLQASLDSSMDSNRKGLRKFLSQARRGQALSYLDHPLNLAWYAAHPCVSQALWHTGLQRTVQIAQDEIVLAFEHDPFEILMMGTYVGSCLGAGGVCAYSAVACLLDANKRVVYARNGRGKVVARQLLAIDEGDRLVGFVVYPENSTSTDLMTAFKAYNLELAGQLGLELYQGQVDRNYDVPVILAQNWWDDGAWCE